MTKLLFVDDGISFDSHSIRKKPYGGAEVAFVSLVECLSKNGFKVVVYNNCEYEGIMNGVEWKKLSGSINEEVCDTLIINRGDKFLNIKKECKNRIFWIHNPANYLIKYRYLSKLFLNNFKIVFSGEYHASTYPFWAPAKERAIIPYGIDNKLFNYKKIRVPPKRKVIFTSNPMRGLSWLLEMWEKNIYKRSNGAILEIFSGFETYGKFGNKHFNEISDILKKAKSLKGLNVIVKKPLPREKLLKELKKSRLFLYKGTSDETYCMALAEAQMVGLPSVVMNYGCMNERVINNKTGYVCNDDKFFCNQTIKLLNDDPLWKNMHKNALKKKNYLTWNEVVDKWKKILN